MPKPDDQVASTLSPADAAKKVKGTVRVPVIDAKIGERAFTVDPQTRVRRYQAQAVPLAAEHILKVGDGFVVTVDGQRLKFA